MSNEQLTTPLKKWDGNKPQEEVSVTCRDCYTTYTDRQSRNDCISAYPYEYPKKGFYWRENKSCLKCYIKNY